MNIQCITPTARYQISYEPDSWQTRLRLWWRCEWAEVFRPAINAGLFLGMVLTTIMAVCLLVVRLIAFTALGG